VNQWLIAGLRRCVACVSLPVLASFLPLPGISASYVPVSRQSRFQLACRCDLTKRRKAWKPSLLHISAVSFPLVYNLNFIHHRPQSEQSLALCRRLKLACGAGKLSDARCHILCQQKQPPDPVWPLDIQNTNNVAFFNAAIPEFSQSRFSASN
jgi:hypothetical protein